MGLVYVHPAIEELQKELMRHPKLLEEMKAAGVPSFEDGLAQMAAYVDLVLHGEYNGNDVAGVCQEILHRLQAKRGAIIIPSDINKI